MRSLLSFILFFVIIILSSCAAGTIGLKSYLSSIFGEKNETENYEVDVKLNDTSKKQEEELLLKLKEEKTNSSVFEDFKNTFNKVKKDVVSTRAFNEAISTANKKYEISTDIFYKNLDQYKKEFNIYNYIEDVDTQVVIKGKVVGTADNFLKISQKRDYKDNFIRNVKIKRNNFFRTVNLTESGFYELEHKGRKYEIFITPGDTVDLIIDHSTAEGLTFIGYKAATNNYIRCRALQEKNLNPVEKNLYNLPFEEFKDKMYYLKNVRDCNFEELLKGEQRVSKAFINEEEANINYEYARDIIGYKNKEGRFDKDKVLKKLVKKINKNKKHNLNNKNYKAFVLDYFDYQSKRNIELKYGKKGMYKYSNVERAKMKFNDIDKLFTDKQTQEFLKTKVTVDIINLVKSYRVNPVVKLFYNEVNNNTFTKQVEDAYYTNVNIDDGAFAPNFTIRDRNGRTFTKNDLKGKYTYIAVWATWCAPCIIEQPHLQRLRDEYANVRNLQILSVSIDKSKDKWLKEMNRKSLSGLQYHAPGNWDSEFVEAFNLKSVPKYILINPDGEIIDLSTSKPSRDIRRRLLDLGISL